MPAVMEETIQVQDAELCQEVVNASEQVANAIMEVVDRISVTNAEEYEAASGILAKIKAKAREIETERKSFTSPLDSLKKRIMDKFRPATEILERAERALKGKVGTYLREEEAKRRKAEEEARRLADKERERREKLAEKAEARGDFEKADAHRARAEEVPVPIVAPTVPQGTGVSIRKNWKAALVSMPELVRAAAGGNALALSLIEFNQAEATRKAKALRDTVPVPGVRFFAEDVVAASAGRAM